MNTVQEQKKEYIPPLVETMELSTNTNAASGCGSDSGILCNFGS